MMIDIKNKDDQEKMRAAGKLASEVLDMISNFVRPGITTGELDRICHDYIVNEQDSARPNYFYRVNFPRQYQTIIMIRKFERDYKQPSLEYEFLNAYPISINAMPVTYEAAQTLKCTVNFNFSRYITNATTVNQAPYPVF